MTNRTHFGQAMNSSFMKLFQNVLLGLLCYIGVQTMNRLDRLEQLNTNVQVTLATSTRDASDLKQASQARDAELLTVHSQLADALTRLSVLEVRVARK